MAGIRDTDIGSYALTPLWLIDLIAARKLSTRALSVFVLLAAKYADRRSGASWPSRKTLAADLAINETTLDDAIAQLRAAGALTVTERYDDAGDRTSNLYTLHFAAPGGNSENANSPPGTHVKRIHGSPSKTPPPVGVETPPGTIVSKNEIQNERDHHVNTDYSHHHHQQPKAGDAGGGGGGPVLTGDPIIAHAVHLYTTEIAAGLTPMMAQELTEWADELQDVPHARETLDEAFRAAAREGRRSWPYVRAVLRRLRSEGWPADCGRKERHDGYVGRRVQRTGKRAEIDYSGWAQ